MKNYLVAETAIFDRKPTPPALQIGAGRVLVVEDSLDNQILLKAFLSKQNLEIETADNGLVGLEMALEHSFDLIFMDIQMPEMDGFEAVHKLRVAGYHGKIVALTAHAMKGDRERCLESGFDDYLCKPLSRYTLLECVSRYIFP